MPADLRALIAAELPSLFEIRHDLHAHPELGYQEHRTAELVRRELAAAGVEHVGGLAGGTGVLGHLSGRNGAGVIGLRADMDALPIEEQTGAEYASTVPGTMHACGHDGHTTILIGAARVLAKLAADDELPRPVTMLFQPAEEGGAGGRRMVEDGCLSGSVLGPPVQQMYGLHGWPTLGLGRVATRVGPMLAAADSFEITIRGTSAHAAFPHVGRDPVLAAAAVITALQQIASRNVDPLDPVVVSVTQIEAGTAHNIIPGTVRLGGTARTLTPQTHGLVQRRLKEIAGDIARAYGCEATVDYHLGYPVTRNHGDAVERFRRLASEGIGAEHVEELASPVMGGEDFAFYCQAVPSCFFALGLLPPGRDIMPQLHQPAFDFNDQAIAVGVELFCRLALGAS